MATESARFWHYALHETRSQLEVRLTSKNEIDGTKNINNFPGNFTRL